MEYLTNGIGWNGVHEDITPIITKPDGSKEYRISDHLASLRVSLTNGSALKGYDYDPWGNLLGGATAPRRGFNDNEKDKENGLFSLGVRKYEEGRFLSLDPLFEKEPEISPYVYAGNAPLNYVDPEGKQRRGVASVPVSILYSPDGVNIGIGGAWGGAPGGSSSGFGIAGGALGTATGGWIASELLDDGGDAPPSSGGSGNAPSSGGNGGSGGGGGALIGGLATVAAQQMAQKGTIVLGKYPDYVNQASKIGAKIFNIPTDIWNKMTATQQWSANAKFLDRAIQRGDNIVLSNKVTDIKEVTGAFKKELDYLIEKGYKLSEDGLKMIKK